MSCGAGMGTEAGTGVAVWAWLISGFASTWRRWVDGIDVVQHFSSVRRIPILIHGSRLLAALAEHGACFALGCVSSNGPDVVISREIRQGSSCRSR